MCLVMSRSTEKNVIPAAGGMTRAPIRLIKGRIFHSDFPVPSTMYGAYIYIVSMMKRLRDDYKKRLKLGLCWTSQHPRQQLNSSHT